MKFSFSVVVPVYNEAGNITALHDELLSVMQSLHGTFEIIYVNDGSTDTSLRELRSLHDATVLDLNRNYGQATALDAGFKHAQGDIVISIDGDGQNDPADIPRLLEKFYNEGFDVVTGWRKVRKDNEKIKTLTLVGRFLRKILIKDTVHDTGCTLRVYKKEAVKSLDLQGEMHRYILALLHWKGFRVCELIVNDRPRVHGNSKYGVSKAARGFIDLIYVWFINKFSQRPLHMFGYASFLFLAVGGVLLLMAVYQKVQFDLSINRSGHFLLGAFSLMASLMLFSFGIIIDLLLKIHLNNSPFEKRYYIRGVKQNK